MRKKPFEARSILVVTLSNLGDVVLTLPVIHSLQEAHPKADMDVIVGVGGQPVFEGDKRIRRVIVYDKRSSWPAKWRHLMEVRRSRYDIIVDLRHSLIGLLGGARRRNAYVDLRLRRLHQTVRHLRALKGLAPNHEEVSFLAGRADAGDDPLPRELADEKIVVASVGSKSHIKKWPAISYAALLDRLAVNDGYRIVLVGDASDAPDAAEVKRLLSSPALDLTGRTDFRQLVSCISRAELVVTNDSAPLHIADALKVRTLAIFGPTDPRKYGPRFSQSRSVRKPLFCSPCEKALCRFGHECMRELGVEEVYRKARQILYDEPAALAPKILMLRLDRMGDVMFSLPAIAAVKKRFPKSFVSLMVRPYTQPLVEGHPLIDEVIPYRYERGGRHRTPIGFLRFLSEIAGRRFDMAFILHPSNRSTWLPFLAGIPYRFGFDSHWPALLTKAVKDKRSEGKKSEADYTADIVRASGTEAVEKNPVFPVSRFDALRIEKRLAAEGCAGDEALIVLHPGASCASKRWPIQRFLELARKIAASHPHRMVVIGGAEEIGNAGCWTEFRDRVLDLTGCLDPKELAALLKRCELLVSNDSGPVHVASAVGTPTVAIFGRNQAGLSVARWRALGEGHTVLREDVGCVVCLAHRCSIDFECLKAVQVESVYEAIQKTLGARKHALQA